MSSMIREMTDLARGGVLRKPKAMAVERVSRPNHVPRRKEAVLPMKARLPMVPPSTFIISPPQRIAWELVP